MRRHRDRARSRSRVVVRAVHRPRHGDHLPREEEVGEEQQVEHRGRLERLPHALAQGGDDVARVEEGQPDQEHVERVAELGTGQHDLGIKEFELTVLISSNELYVKKYNL